MIILLWCWLWSASVAVSWPSGAFDANPATGRIGCDEVHKRCTFREECTKGLFNYMKDCADVLNGLTNRCPWSCRRTLISLMSHEAGRELAMCDCKDDIFCRTHKERLEICRPEVSHATADHTVVSCSIAELICSSDTQCSTALTYYHRFCKSMFHGHKCTRRCNNSLDILGRQEKAAKLHDCYCDGSEDFPCIRIKQNTQRLCLGKEEYVEEMHPMYKTTPEPSSTGRTLRPCCLTLVVSCILILWSYRTCTDNWHIFLIETKRLTERLSSMMQRLLRSLYFSVWPWWWTSEKKLRIGESDFIYYHFNSQY